MRVTSSNVGLPARLEQLRQGLARDELLDGDAAQTALFEGVEEAGDQVVVEGGQHPSLALKQLHRLPIVHGAEREFLQRDSLVIGSIAGDVDPPKRAPRPSGARIS